MKPPNTWADYQKIAQYFSEANFNSGKSLPGLCFSEEDFEKDFLSFCASYTRQPVSPSEKITPEIENAVFSFQYDFRTGKPLINTAGFVKSLEKYKLLQKFRATSPRPNQAFFSYKATLPLPLQMQAWSTKPKVTQP